MRSLRTKPFIALLVVLSISVLTQAFTPVTFVRDQYNTPELPANCGTIQVEADHKLAYRAFAVGVQRYRWDGTAWVFVEPIATLYKDAEYTDKDAIHYAGPTWLANSGGKVVATKVNQCTPDATSIPWLLLKATSNQGPGLFGVVSFIQRINTKGGTAPIAPGTQVGALADIPYTTEYYFYRPIY
jgi:hypothetical protein